MSDISNLKKINNQSTWTLFFLSLVTLGIYDYMWAWKNSDAFNKEMNSNVSAKLILVAAIVVGVSEFILTIMLDDVFSEDAYYSIDFISLIAIYIIWAIWSFEMKKALETYAKYQFSLNLKLNPIWTLLFTNFYICYCINDLENDRAKQHALESAKQYQQHKSNQNSSDQSQNK